MQTWNYLILLKVIHQGRKLEAMIRPSHRYDQQLLQVPEVSAPPLMIPAINVEEYDSSIDARIIYKPALTSEKLSERPLRFENTKGAIPIIIVEEFDVANMGS